MDVAILHNVIDHESDILSSLPYSIRGKLPVPAGRDLYMDVNTRRQGLLGDIL